MKATKKSVFTLFLILLPIFLLTLYGLRTVATAATSPIISPALSIISSNMQMKKCGLDENNLYFNSEDFEDFLNVNSLNAITVTSLPSEFEGSLFVGDTPVIANQTIQKNDINKLYFKPTRKDISKSTFYFFANDISCENSIKCTVFLLDEINTAPAISQDVINQENLSTQKNIMVYSSLHGEDHEKDALTFELTKEASHGIVNIDAETGNYTYTPALDYVGKDNFEYVCIDSYGNRSEEATIDINVEKSKNNTFFSDLTAHKEHNSAIKASDYGIMSGKIINGKKCFSPNDTPTKAEFVYMALKSMGLDQNITATETAFADDSDIPSNLKKYVAFASNSGFVSGTKLENDTFFYPNSPVSRAECAVILNNMIDAKPTSKELNYTDKNDIPSWAVEDIITLSELNIMEEISENNFAPSSNITNIEAAKIFCKVYEHINN